MGDGTGNNCSLDDPIRLRTQMIVLDCRAQDLAEVDPFGLEGHGPSVLQHDCSAIKVYLWLWLDR
jgi:hypothetical protein